MDTIGSRLKLMLVKLGMNQKELAEKLNVSQSTVNGYTRNYREPDMDTIIRLSKILNTSVEYLITGKNIDKITSSDFNKIIEKYDNSQTLQKQINIAESDIGLKLINIDEKLQELQEQKEKAKKIDPIIFPTKKRRNGIKIPVYGYVAAGVPIEAIEDILDYEEIDEELAETGEFFALKIKGNSMEPYIMQEDIVIVRKQPTAENGEIVIAFINGDEATCKKIKRTSEGIMFISFNSAYEPMYYSRNEVNDLPVVILGKVIEMRRTFN